MWNKQDLLQYFNENPYLRDSNMFLGSDYDETMDNIKNELRSIAEDEKFDVKLQKILATVPILEQLRIINSIKTLHKLDIRYNIARRDFAELLANVI